MVGDTDGTRVSPFHSPGQWKMLGLERGRPAPPTYFEALDYPRSANDYESFEKLQPQNISLKCDRYSKGNHFNDYSVSYTPLQAWESPKSHSSKILYHVFPDESSPGTSGYTIQSNLTVPEEGRKSTSQTCLYIQAQNKPTKSQSSLHVPGPSGHSTSHTSMHSPGRIDFSGSKQSLHVSEGSGRSASNTNLYFQNTSGLYGSQEEMAVSYGNKSSKYRTHTVTDAERTAATLAFVDDTSSLRKDKAADRATLYCACGAICFIITLIVLLVYFA